MRRILLLSLWLTVPGVCGAQVRLAPPVQLSLFAPAPVLVAPVAFPALAAPVLLAPAPSLSSVFAAVPAPVLKAFHAGDAPAYLKAARTHEYQPPDGDEHQSALYQLGLEREAAERAMLAVEQPAVPAGRSTKIDYETFGRRLAQTSGLSSNPFNGTSAKRRILKAAGYTRLYGAGGKPIAIDDASDVRIGKVFANVLRAYERR